MPLSFIHPQYRLGTLETGFQKCHGGVPGLGGRFGIMPGLPGFVAERVHSTGIRLDLDPFALARSGSQ